jgi:hypothetical protein
MTVTAVPGLPQPCHEDPRLLTQQVPSTLDQDVIEGRVARAITLDAATTALPRELVASLARPRYYPPADHAVQWFADTWASATFSFLRALVLHTTETSGWPGYGGGGSAPNFTAMPDPAAKRLVWRQHFGCDQSGRALLNLPGGVNTNTTNVVQVELIGTCASGGPGMFWPDAPDWALAELAKFVVWLHDEWGVLPQASVTWKAYPGSYGTHNGVRLGGSDWLAYRGILAHEHVTENDHGDTGRFPIERLLAYTTGDDMSQADVDAILTGVKAYIDSKVPALVRGALADPWVNADALVDDKTKQISPLNMILQGYVRTPGLLLATKLPTGQTVGQALAAAVAQTDTLEASEAAQSTALAGAVKSITDGVVSQLLGSGIAGIDEPKLRQVVGAAVHDQLASTEFVARPTA